MAFMTSNLLSMSNTAITPYLGGGVGISRNKMGTDSCNTKMGFLTDRFV